MADVRGLDKVLREPIENVTFKRAAWAYGCAKTGTAEESQLLALLWRVIGRECSGGSMPVQKCAEVRTP